MQELFVDKTNFFKFHSISDKAGLDQLNTITATRSAYLSESFHPYPWLPRKGKSPVLKTCTKSHQLNRHIKFFLLYSFTCISQTFVRILPKWSKPRYLKAEALQVPQKI